MAFDYPYLIRSLFYILHHPIIVYVGYFMVRWHLPVLVKYPSSWFWLKSAPREREDSFAAARLSRQVGGVRKILTSSTFVSSPRGDLSSASDTSPYNVGFAAIALCLFSPPA